MRGEKYKIFQWNGKDLFLQKANSSDEFTVLSFEEIAHEAREQLCRDKDNGVTTREVMLLEDKKIAFLLSPEEIEADRIKRLRISRLLAQIAGYEEAEASKDKVMPPHAKAILIALRAELGQLIPLDPTAPTTDQRRTNESVVHEDFILKNGRPNV